VEGPLTAQITLPLRHGGLGLAHTGPAEGRAAYLAAAAATHRATGMLDGMLEGPTAFRPFDGPGGVELRAQWEELHGGAGDLWPPEVRDVNPDNLGVIADAQSTFSRHIAAAKLSSLLESFDAHSVNGRSARARILSCACRPASAWLDTLPLTSTLELKSGEVRTGLRHRLGLSMMPPNAPSLLCSCGAALNGNTADHAMRCSSLAALTTLRNDILKGILRRAVHRAGIASTLEPHRGCQHLSGWSQHPC
jgi:hypothetical protein